MSRKPSQNTADQIEELDDDDFSTEELETYCPQKEEEELEADEDVYKILEYIDLDWPAQSIAINGSKIYLGTNPDLDTKNNHREINLVETTICNNTCTDIKFNKRPINQYINKIRFENFIFAISDDTLAVYDISLTLYRQVRGNYGYALHVDSERVYAGTSDGFVEIYDHELNFVSKMKIHEKPIDAICVSNKIIFTGSQDHTAKLTDLSGNNVRTIKNPCDVNCLDVFDQKMVFGDDNGILHIMDSRRDDIEEISWHKTPISALKWMDADVFASGSDEQLCIWDTSLEEEWDYHKYLLFVHQGQRFYKDCAFIDGKIITASQDGLCIFKPISFD